jgi:hypothetical protein
MDDSLKCDGNYQCQDENFVVFPNAGSIVRGVFGLLKLIENSE